jgi:hypothetical protein
MAASVTGSALVYIDDATSRLMQILFTGSESTFGYFEATRQYLAKHGKPLAFYSDKASIFRVNHASATGGDGHPQFARALYELNIDGICANTPNLGRRYCNRKNSGTICRIPFRRFVVLSLEAKLPQEIARRMRGEEKHGQDRIWNEPVFGRLRRTYELFAKSRALPPLH